ncbi:MAG: hypothetical protein KJ935_06740 [Candidatus Omnitrophica bacterium]|nr:hypothetical protein [Candidatus Omnitrophota bacterium]
MTDSPGLRDLELLHRRLEELRHLLGSICDYLDRGRPSPDQERATWAAEKVAEETATALDQKLEGLVALARRTDPALLDRWVDLHQAVLREAKTEIEGEESDNSDEGFVRTALFVINQETEKWEEVRAGGRYHVIGNRYFLRHNDRIARKHFGF